MRTKLPKPKIHENESVNETDMEYFDTMRTSPSHVISMASSSAFLAAETADKIDCALCNTWNTISIPSHSMMYVNLASYNTLAVISAEQEGYKTLALSVILPFFRRIFLILLTDFIKFWTEFSSVWRTISTILGMDPQNWGTVPFWFLLPWAKSK